MIRPIPSGAQLLGDYGDDYWAGEGHSVLDGEEGFASAAARLFHRLRGGNEDFPIELDQSPGPTAGAAAGAAGSAADAAGSAADAPGAGDDMAAAPARAKGKARQGSGDGATAAAAVAPAAAAAPMTEPSVPVIDAASSIRQHCTPCGHIYFSNAAANGATAAPAAAAAASVPAEAASSAAGAAPAAVDLTGDEHDEEMQQAIAASLACDGAAAEDENEQAQRAIAMSLADQGSPSAAGAAAASGATHDRDSAQPGEADDEPRAKRERPADESAAGGAAADQPLCNDETFEVPAASAAGASADQAVGDGGLRGFLAEMRGEPTAPELAQRVRLLCRAIRAVDLSAAATDAESQTAVQALADATEEFRYQVASCAVRSWRALSDGQKRGVLHAILDEAGF